MGDASHITKPRIYVACLAAYNSGHLHGEWINADQDEEDIFADINDVLRRKTFAWRNSSIAAACASATSTTSRCILTGALPRYLAGRAPARAVTC